MIKIKIGELKRKRKIDKKLKELENREFQRL